MKKTYLLVILFGVLSAQNPEGVEVQPPAAKIIPWADTLFGDVRTDNYHWLRYISDSDVRSYLEAENNYTEEIMKPTKQLQVKLYDELRNRIKETDLTVPEKIDSFYYYLRTEKGKEYDILCRKKGTLLAEEEILSDQNELARGHNYYSIGTYAISPDHCLLAYTTDTTGSEIYALFVKDIVADTLYRETFPEMDYNIVWANDNRTFFYMTQDSTMRPYRLYRHVLGSPVSDDVLVYEEPDGAFFMRISGTRSEEYILLWLESKTTSEVWYLDADVPGDSFRVIFPRRSGVEYYIEHSGDFFFVLTNDNAVNFKLGKLPVKDLNPEKWLELIPHSSSKLIEGFDAFKEYLTVYERIKGLQKLLVINLKTNQRSYVDFPERACSFWTTGNHEYDTEILRFTYTSLVTPRSVYDYNMRTKKRELKKQDEVKGYNPKNYATEWLYARAQDGTEVPISLVYKKGIKKDGKAPLLLDGYGAYGASNDPYFSSNRVCLLDRGFMIALAHTRGGSEMGRYWYEQGKLLNKKNTFTDFIACAEHLIARKYTSSEKLVIEGGSAGGMLIGAVLNMCPGLFKMAIAEVPFVDVLNTMLDPTIPLTVLEYEEWGDPNNKEFYEYIRSYSPYDNVRAQTYPHMLITASLYDPRVGFWEAAKWTANLRALKTDKNLLLLKMNLLAGHGGVSGRYEYLREVAFKYAFILDLMDIEGIQKKTSDDYKID